MKDIVIGLVAKFLVNDMAAWAAGADTTAFKTKVHAAVSGAIPSKFVDTALDGYADQMIDAAVKVAQDQPDLVAAITALADHDLPSAEAALKKALGSVLSGDLAALVANL